MTTDTLNEREFELINIIGGDLAANQRDLSRQMNLSLGMTNMVLRRLITKGYIRIKQLNQRKVEYMLTPKGFAEKMRKSMRYTMKTISSIGLIQQGISRVLDNLYSEGVREFYVLGSEDLTNLIENAFRQRNWPEAVLRRIEDPALAKPNSMLLICREEPGAIPQGVRNLNMVEELAKSELLGKE